MIRILKKRNKYDWIIVVTIASLAWGQFELLGAFTPIRMLGVVGLIIGVKHFKYIAKYYKNWLFLFLFWWLYMLIGLLWTPDKQLGIIQLFHQTTMIGSMILLFYSATKSLNYNNDIIIGWALFLCITIPIAIWEITTVSHLTSGSFNDNGPTKLFAAVTFQNYNSYVVMIIFALTFLLSSFFISIKGKCYFVVLCILSTIILIINASRGGIVCAGIMISLCFMLNLKYSTSIITKALTIITLCGVLFIIFNNIDSIIIFENIASRMSGGTELFHDNNRMFIWSEGLRTVWDNCFLGRGPGSMIETYRDNTSCYIHYAHNFYLEMLMENGLIITLLFFMLFYHSVSELLHSSRPYCKYLGYAVGISSILLFLIDDYYTARSGVWIYIACVVVLSNIRLYIDHYEQGFIHTSK